MAKAKKAPENVTTMRLRGVTRQGHPLWGDTGRPILIGDLCRHVEYGRCQVRQVKPSNVVVKQVDSGNTFTVHPNEVEREFDALATLVEAEAWG